MSQRCDHSSRVGGRGDKRHILQDSGRNTSKERGDLKQTAMQAQNRRVPVSTLKKRLFEACNKGTVMNVSTLLRAGGQLHWTDDWGFMPLHYACIKNNYLVVQFLLRESRNRGSASVNLPLSSGETPLHVACFTGDLPLVNLLLRHGAFPMAINCCGDTPLHEACAVGAEKVVEQLLMHPGVDINARNFYGWTPLMCMFALKKQDLFSALVKIGADVNVLGKASIIELLISKGADINVADYMGITALSMACKRGRRKTAARLIQAGADVNNKSVLNTLMVLSNKGDLNFITLLLQSGANVNAVQENGDSALCCASRAGHTQTVRLLLQHGARLYLPGARSALEVASHSGHYYLLKYRANTLAGTGPVTLVLASLAAAAERTFKACFPYLKRLCGTLWVFSWTIEDGFPIPLFSFKKIQLKSS